MKPKKFRVNLHFFGIFFKIACGTVNYVPIFSELTHFSMITMYYALLAGFKTLQKYAEIRRNTLSKTPSNTQKYAEIRRNTLSKTPSNTQKYVETPKQRPQAKTPQAKTPQAKTQQGGCVSPIFLRKCSFCAETNRQTYWKHP